MPDHPMYAAALAEEVRLYDEISHGDPMDAEPDWFEPRATATAPLPPTFEQWMLEGIERGWLQQDGWGVRLSNLGQSHLADITSRLFDVRVA